MSLCFSLTVLPSQIWPWLPLSEVPRHYLRRLSAWRRNDRLSFLSLPAVVILAFLYFPLDFLYFYLFSLTLSFLQTMLSRSFMMLLKQVNLCATWRLTHASLWCLLKIVWELHWRWWRLLLRRLACVPTTSMPWASPLKTLFRRYRSTCQTCTSFMMLTQLDRWLVRALKYMEFYFFKGCIKLFLALFRQRKHIWILDTLFFSYYRTDVYRLKSFFYGHVTQMMMWKFRFKAVLHLRFTTSRFTVTYLPFRSTSFHLVPG